MRATETGKSMQHHELKRFLAHSPRSPEGRAESHVATLKQKSPVKTRMAGRRLSKSAIGLCIQALCSDGIADA
jgi:hypothetical protein